MGKCFTRNYAWSGGFYELCFELPKASEAAVRAALAELWSTPNLEGCYLDRDIEPSAQLKIFPLDIPPHGHQYGLASFPNGRTCACGSCATDYEDDGWWIDFYLPLGSLNFIYPVGAYPFVSKMETPPELWLEPVNLWLKSLAENIYGQVNFTIAVIGFEVDAIEVRNQALVTIPEERWEGILLPVNGILNWYPPTIYQSQIKLYKRV